MRLPHPFLDRIVTRAALRRAGDWMEARARRGICFSQNDMSLANADGATFRADVNNALQALATNNSGATAPSTTYAHQTWYDTTANVRKRRNAANSAWIIEATLATTFVVDRAANTIWAETDIGKTYRITTGYTQTVTAAATLGDGWFVEFRVEAGQTLVIDPNGAETIDGATTLSIVGPASGTVHCNGTAFYTRGVRYNENSIVTVTGDYTVLTTDHVVINNRAATNTLTLPAAASFTGRELFIKTIQAQLVNSASSNVVPLTSAAAGTAILPATDGAWCVLKSDGTNWITIAGSAV